MIDAVVEACTINHNTHQPRTLCGVPIFMGSVVVSGRLSIYEFMRSSRWQVELAPVLSFIPWEQYFANFVDDYFKVGSSKGFNLA